MTNNITERSKEQLNPEMALVVYKSDNKEFYIEMHRINHSGRMLEGVPLSEKCAAEIAGALFGIVCASAVIKDIAGI